MDDKHKPNLVADASRPPQPGRTRLAPSPTGALHLGNIRTFLINWALARRLGQSIVLRLEDIDSPRIRPGSDRQILDILRWLGMDWDEGPVYQTQRMDLYIAALEQLVGQGRLFACSCTRADLVTADQASADGHDLRYPGTCRARLLKTDWKSKFPVGIPGDCSLRFRVDEETIRFDDAFAGPIESRPHAEVGDFVVMAKVGMPSYQLAVVVDDIDQSITDVVRGNDLLTSTGRQMLLYRHLKAGDRIPRWMHLPLIVGNDGRKLAKRHGDSRIESYRARGTTAERIIGLTAYWCGMTSTRQSLSLAEFTAGLSLNNIPKADTVFGPEDDRFLLE